MTDSSGATYLSAFQEAGEEILGVSARELQGWRDSDDPQASEVFFAAQFSTWVFKLKVKEDSWQDETRLKCTVVKAERVSRSVGRVPA